MKEIKILFYESDIRVLKELARDNNTANAIALAKTMLTRHEVLESLFDKIFGKENNRITRI